MHASTQIAVPPMQTDVRHDDSPIQIAALNHWFGTGEARKQALHEIDLTIAKGFLTVLVGASGSGKTTLLTLIGCLRDVQDGQAVVLGKELRGAGGRTRVALRQRMGFIFQAHNLHNSLTAKQNVLMGVDVHGLKDDQAADEAAIHLLELVGLGNRIDYYPGNLSGGQKQRVAVARALVGNPDIVFADEPTAALDKESGLQVVTMLKALGQVRGTTTLMVTHDNRILDMADRIITMEDGRLIKDEVL